MRCKSSNHGTIYPQSRFSTMCSRVARAKARIYGHQQTNVCGTKRRMYWPDSSQRQPTLDARVQRHIGERLRAMYDDVLAQGISIHLAELLKQLDEPEHEGHPRHDC